MKALLLPIIFCPNCLKITKRETVHAAALICTMCVVSTINLSTARASSSTISGSRSGASSSWRGLGRRTSTSLAHEWTTFGTSTNTTATLLTAIQATTQLTRDRLQVHEIAETTTSAFPHLVLSAARLAEIGDRGQLRIDGLPVIPAVVDSNHGFLRIFLVLELDVDISNKMITKVVTHVHLFYLPVLLLQFEEDILKERIVVLLRLYVVHDIRSGSCGGWCDPVRSRSFVLGILKHVLQQERLTERGFVVKS